MSSRKKEIKEEHTETGLIRTTSKKTPVYAPASGAANVDFCAQGKFLIFTGNCVLPKGSPLKDTMSPKACADVRSVLNRRSQKLSYSWAEFERYLDRHPLPKPRIVHNFYLAATAS